MANKLRIVKMGSETVYHKGMYSGYVGETFGQGRKYGYHINLARGTKNYPAPKSNYKTKASAIKAVKTWLNKMDK